MNTEYLNAKVDGGFLPDTDPTNNTNNQGDSDAQDKSDGSEPNQSKPSISEARFRANRQNAQKSTGPRTARGKSYSRSNAMRHGLLSKPILYNHDGAPINDDFHALMERLQETYGTDDLRVELLTETILVECWRQRKALDIEAQCLEDPRHFSSMGYIPNLQRYQTASQRALVKSLELLEKKSPPKSAEDEGKAEAAPSTLEPENPPQATSRLAVVSADQRAPEPSSESENGAAGGKDSAPTGEVEEAA